VPLVLEIGTGSGYQAAVLATIGARVRSLERLPALAAAARERLAGLGLDGAVAGAVEVIVTDGSLGDPATAPHARVIVTAGAPLVPGPLVDQLGEGGQLVVPVGSAGDQEMIVITRQAGRLTETPVGRCAFVPLIGAAGFRPGAARSPIVGGRDRPPRRTFRFADIERGWLVQDSDEKPFGTVVSSGETLLTVSRGFLSSKQYLPPSAVAEVHEGVVRLNVTARWVEAQGWDRAGGRKQR
jgi:Protein-L-isoaspartate(D-aspartate) O-methyltransferase (PCMT)